MKKIYRVDLGSLISIGFVILLLIGPFAFVFERVPVHMRLVVILVIVFFTFFLFLLMKYELILTEDTIQAKRLITAFLDKYQTMRFDEIAEVWNEVGPFSDEPNIVFKSRDPSKKTLCISVGSALPLQALVDILERLPKNTKINFEPLLWKHLKHPPKPTTPRRVLAAGLIISAIIAAASAYVWWAVSVRR